MELPDSIREDLVEELDSFLDNFDENPDPETVTGYIVELLEQFADDYGIEDIFVKLEESGALEAPFADAVENEMGSNDEFEFTGEEVVSLLERMCGIEWNDELNDDEDDFDEDDEDEFSDEV